MSPLPPMPSPTPGEGNPTNDQKKMERLKKVRLIQDTFKKHIVEHERNAKEKFHKEKDAWKPENPKKPLQGIEPKPGVVTPMRPVEKMPIVKSKKRGL